jgi:hypothetical protein
MRAEPPQQREKDQEGDADPEFRLVEEMHAIPLS